MQTLSRQDAKTAGQKTYFTGVACRNGHIEVRSVANGVCYQCRRDAQNTYRASTVEADRESSREWYANNKEHAAEWKKQWVKDHPKEYKARRKRYRNQSTVRAREMLAASKWSSAKKSLPFDLDFEWLLKKLETGTCELTGLPFKLEPLEGGLQNPYTASLDRVTPKLGYIKSNVRMVLWALNAAFNSYGEQVYADIARVYLARHGGLSQQALLGLDDQSAGLT